MSGEQEGGLTRSQIAHHEAAHAVMAHRLGPGIHQSGINLNHQSEAGANGGAMCNLWDDDPSVSEKKRQRSLLENLMIVCAGPACDAKMTGRSLQQALQTQVSDLANAKQLLKKSPLVNRDGQDNGENEEQYLLVAAMKAASDQLAKPEVWQAIEKVANATINSNGTLSREEFLRILS